MRCLRLAVFALAFVLGCEDPPPPPGSGQFVLGIRTVPPTASNPTLSGGTGENLSGLTGIDATILRVDVVHRTDASDPATERVITVDAATHVLHLVGDLTDQSKRVLAFLNVPVGFVLEVRAITSSLTITLRGQTYPVEVPSGAQTGLKIVPVDGVPFPIIADERTGARILFDPFFQLIRNKGQGFKIKPLLEAEHIPVSELSPVLLDRIVVDFKDGVDRATIDKLNAQIGATVIASDGPTNYFLLQLPPTISLIDALAYYAGKGEVLFTLPDNVIGLRAPLTPCNQNFPPQGADVSNPLIAVKAPDAWGTLAFDTAAGLAPDTRALLAVVDNEFDLASQDLFLQIGINQGELVGAGIDHGVKFFDADNDGTVTPAEIQQFDTDGDGIITFWDLNAPALKCLCDPAPRALPLPTNCGSLTCDFDRDGKVTALDLVNGVQCSSGSHCYGFQDGVDDDPIPGNPNFIDDLVGWNFAGNNNNPGLVKTNGLFLSEDHGTAVAGEIAAVGQVAPANMCTVGKVAGMNWRARLLPIKLFGAPPQQGHDDFPPDGRNRANAYLALRYAIERGADAVNASWGATYYEVGASSQGTGTTLPGFYPNLDSKTFDKLLPNLAKEATRLAPGKTLIVAAAQNFAQNADDPKIYDWPVEMKAQLPDNIIGVAGAAIDYMTGSIGAGGGEVGPGGDFGLMPNQGTLDITAPLNQQFLLGADPGLHDHAALFTASCGRVGAGVAAS